jgi:putative FmdB family regulatory protein
MPTYSYRCQACQHLFEDFLPIKKRKIPETKPCPECGEKRIIQAIIYAPNITIDGSVDIHKATGGFKDAMQKVCEAPGIKGSKRAEDLKSRYNL